MKSLDSFDFAAIPSLNKPLTLELGRCEYLIAHDNVIALGNSGTGKTHICLALGLAACQRGFSVSFFTAAGCLFAGIRCDDALSVALFFTAAFCTMHFTLPNWWSVIIPQAGKHVGTVFGLANGIGVFGALASQGFVGWFTDHQKTAYGLTGRAQWDPLFDVYVGVLLCGGIAWWLYRFTPLSDLAQEPTEGETW